MVADCAPYRLGRRGGAGSDDIKMPAYAAQCESVGTDARKCSGAEKVEEQPAEERGLLKRSEMAGAQ